MAGFSGYNTLLVFLHLGWASPVMSKNVPVPEINLGARIKELRLQRNLSIRAISRLSGISINALSRIERNLSSPSVSTLYQIAEALNVPMIRFFQDSSQQQDVIFCKKDQSIKIPFLRGFWESLRCEQFAGGIQPFLLTLEAGGGSGHFKMLHSAEEFVYCLRGQIEYEVEKERFLLEPGDSLMFSARLKHRWRNAGKDLCQALIVLFDRPEELKQGEILFVEDDSEIEPKH